MGQFTHAMSQFKICSVQQKKSLDDLKTFLETPITNSLPLHWLQLGWWTKHSNSNVLVFEFYRIHKFFRDV